MRRTFWRLQAWATRENLAAAAAEEEEEEEEEEDEQDKEEEEEGPDGEELNSENEVSSHNDDRKVVRKRPRASASMLGEYFARDECERFLHRKARSSRSSRTKIHHEGSAQTERGKIHEAELERALMANDKVRFYDLSRQMDFDMDVGTILRQYKDSAEYDLIVLAQAPLIAPRTGGGGIPWIDELRSAGADFAHARPDFIFLTPQTGELLVVDAKSSSSLKFSHRVQVAVYSILLHDLLAFHRLDMDFSVAPYGGVWLPCESQSWGSILLHGPVRFNLSADLKSMRAFLSGSLGRILSSRHSENSLRWRLAPHCTSCDFLNSCRDTRDGALVGHAPHLPSECVTILEDMHDDAENLPLKDIEDLIPEDGGLRLARLNASLRDFRDVLENHTCKTRVGRGLLLTGFFDLSYGAEVLIIDAVARPDKLPQEPLVVSCRLRNSADYCSWSSGPDNSDSMSAFVNALFKMLQPSLHESKSLACVAWDSPALSLFTQILVKVAVSEAQRARSCNDNAASEEEEADMLSKRASLLAWSIGDRSMLEDLPYTVDLFGAAQIPKISHFKSMKVAQLAARLSQANPPGLLPKWLTEKHAKSSGGLNKEGLAQAVHLVEALLFFDKVDLAKDFSFISETDLRSEIQEAESAYLDSIRASRANRVCFLRPFLAKHFVLPIPGFYTLADCVRTMVSSSSRATGRVFSNQEMQDMWSQGTENGIDNLLMRRANHLCELVTKVHIMVRAHKQLCALPSPPPFAVSRILALSQESLVRAATKEQLRALAAARRQHEIRSSLPMEELPLEGKIFKLVSTGENKKVAGTYKALSKNCTFRADGDVTADLASKLATGDTFPQWYLVPATPIAWKQLLLTDDIDFMDTFPDSIPFSHGVASLQSTNRTTNPQTILVQIRGVMASGVQGQERWPEKDHVYFLVKRCVNFACKRLIQELEALSRGDPAGFITLCKNPAQWEASMPRLDLKVNKKRQFFDGLHASQRMAVENCLQRRMQVIWGPPGSGKTFTAARVVLEILNTDTPAPRVAIVMASTNSAINTCLSHIREACQTFGLKRVCIRQIASNSGQGEDGGFATVEPGNVKAKLWGNYDMTILGTTPWQLFKCPGIKENRNDCVATPGFATLLLIDEASQMHEAHAAIGLRALHPEWGRLVVVGDHKQLGPVDELDGPAARSFLDTCISQGVEDAIAKKLATKLLENLRMNTAMGKLLHGPYGSDYQVVGSHRRESLKISQLGKADSLHPLLQDPTIGLRFVELKWPLERVSSSDLLDKEAAFAMDVIRSYQAKYKSASSSSAPSSSSSSDPSWTLTILVVTPHHTQRRAMRRAIASHFSAEEAAAIRVDTVEKAQGQTFDLVLVLYGIQSHRAIAREATFIFDERRLNVAISRARYRTIVLAGENLTEVSPRALIDPVVQRGWAEMCRLRDFAAAAGSHSIENLGQ